MQDLFFKPSRLDAVIGLACLEYCKRRDVIAINALLCSVEGEEKEHLMDFFCSVLIHRFDAETQQFIDETVIEQHGDAANMLHFFNECGGIYSVWERQNYAVPASQAPSIAILIA